MHVLCSCSSLVSFFFCLLFILQLLRLTYTFPLGACTNVFLQRQFSPFWKFSEENCQEYCIKRSTTTKWRTNMSVIKSKCTKCTVFLNSRVNSNRWELIFLFLLHLLSFRCVKFGIRFHKFFMRTVYGQNGCLILWSHCCHHIYMCSCFFFLLFLEIPEIDVVISTYTHTQIQGNMEHCFISLELFNRSPILFSLYFGWFVGRVHFANTYKRLQHGLWQFNEYYYHAISGKLIPVAGKYFSRQGCW